MQPTETYSCDKKPNYYYATKFIVITNIGDMC